MQYKNGVSVIVPCYNREEYLKECVESVLNQEGNFPVEIIIADDGSTDDSIKVIQDFENTTIIKGNGIQEYISNIRQPKQSL
jgi:glycosyltransferase involved in cell wall biosynthesis